MKTSLHLFQICLLGAFLFQSFTSEAQPVVKIADFTTHNLYLRSDGSLWGSGQNFYGQLGADTNQCEYTNGFLNGANLLVCSGVKAIAAGNERSFFVRSDGSLWAMGGNGPGVLGDGTMEDAHRPIKIVDSGVVDVVATEESTLFLKDDGSLWGFGYNMCGQLGDGAENNVVGVPEKIVDSGVAAIAAGANHSLFIKTDGTLWGMGNNISGQLGDGTDKNSLRPKQLVAGKVTGMAAGYYHSLFIKSDGSLWAMGLNDSYQLGNCTSDDAKRPVMVVSSNVVAVAARRYGSLFLKSDGSLWAMGASYFNNYGEGISFETFCPVQLVGGKNAPLVASYYYNAALKNTVSVLAKSFKNQTSSSDGTTGSITQSTLATTNLPGSNTITIELMMDGNVRLTYGGTVGVKYALDRAYELTATEWFPQCTNTAGVGGVLVITNTPDTTKNNFWRIRSIP